MTPPAIDNLRARERKIELVLVGVFGMLFVYALADWLSLLPGDAAFQPRRFVALTGGMVLQPIAAIMRPRSFALFIVLLALSVGLLVVSFFMAS